MKIRPVGADLFHVNRETNTSKLVGLSLFKYEDDARSNKLKIHE